MSPRTSNVSARKLVQTGVSQEFLQRVLDRVEDATFEKKITCKECGRTTPAQFPDVRALIDAVEMAMKAAPPEREEIAVAHPRVEEIRNLSDTELEMLVAAGYSG